jgi:predicted enzyme related to lactoylglutathione lyase
MADLSIRGRFVWHELMTTDPASAAAFFGSVLGWQTQRFGPTPSYQMFTANGRGVGGLMPLPDEAKAGGTPPMWVLYIATPDVDETAAQAASLGGKILRAAEDIPTVGRFALLADPQGALFAAFTPLPAQTGADTPGAADFSWHELYTTDWKSALVFYRRLFGWKATHAMDMGPAMGTYQMYGLDGTDLGGMMNMPAGTPGGPRWLAYMRVPDAGKTAGTIKRLRARILHGPAEVPGGDLIVQALDLQGVPFAIHSAKPAATPAPKQRAATKKATPAATPAPKKRAASTKAAPPKKPKTIAAKKKAAATKKRR